MAESEVRERYNELLKQGYSPGTALRKTELEFGEPGEERERRLREKRGHTEVRRSEPVSRPKTKDVKTKTFGRAKPGGGFLSDLASVGRGIVRGAKKVDRYIESPGFQRGVGRVHGMSSSFLGLGDEPRKKKKHHRKAKKKRQRKKSGGKRKMVKIYYY